MNNQSRLWLFAIEDTSVQLTWGSLPSGTTRVEVGDTAAKLKTIELKTSGSGVDGSGTNGGPGSLIIEELPPATTLDFTVRNHGLPGGGATRKFTTLASGPGHELFRFATISDMHLGEVGFGWRGSIVEDPQPDEAFPIRSTRAALNELTKWGAQLLVVKGDVTSSGRVGQWETFADLIKDLDIPVEVIPGNHDAGALRPVPASPKSERATEMYGPQITVAEAFARFDLGTPKPIRHLDLPGIRLVLTETDRTDQSDRRGGSIKERSAAILERLNVAPTPVMLIGHHQPMPLPFPYYLPRGIPMSESHDLLSLGRSVNPALFVSVGHTHRHRRRKMAGVTVVEVGAVKDYPGTWAGYVVYEGGIRQVVRRVGTPDLLAWTDKSAAAALGLWGRWSPGTIDDRCFTHLWPIHTRPPAS